MTERKRLIELLSQIDYACDNGSNLQDRIEYIADYLLENGVIVPQCKVGDAVYILAGPFGKKYEQDVCVGFYISDNGVTQVRTRNKKGNHGTYGIMGETLFLTKEEAEKALEERRENETKRTT